MGIIQKLELKKFARRNWQERYADSMSQKKLEQELEKQTGLGGVQPSPDGAQGGMCKSMFIDVVNMNCMRVESEFEGPDCDVCDSVEEYVRYEQHHLNVVHQTCDEDMKVEKKYHGRVVLLHRMSV